MRRAVEELSRAVTRGDHSLIPNSPQDNGHGIGTVFLEGKVATTPGRAAKASNHIS